MGHPDPDCNRHYRRVTISSVHQTRTGLPVTGGRHPRSIAIDSGRGEAGGAVNITGAVTSVRVPASHLSNEEL